MNSDADDFAGRQEPGDDEEQPVKVLVEQEQETAPDFVEKVKRRIHRRTMAAQYASLSWYLPKVVMVEMIGVVRHLVAGMSGKEEGR